MRYPLLFSFLLCLSLHVSAQIITLTGKVTDSKTGQTIPGVTIRTGNYGTSTDRDGAFVLIADEPVVKLNGISVSSIGYQKMQVAYSGIVYHIKLSASSQQLNAVVISGAGETILQKAIRKIPENYPVKDVDLRGLLRFQHTAKDSLVSHYYYQADAEIKLHYAGGYTGKNAAQVTMVQKKDTLIDDHKGMPITWIGGYTIIPYHDMVQIHVPFINTKTLKNYTYTMNGKEKLNGRKVYVINFYANKLVNVAGTIYIDTANYAFSRITFTNYHINTGRSIPIDKSTMSTDYQLLNGKWYLGNVKVINISHHDTRQLYRVTEYATTFVDSVNTQAISFKADIPLHTEERTIKPAEGITAIAWNNRDMMAKDTLFTPVVVPVIDTPKHSALKKLLIAVNRYVLKDNIRYIYAINRSPLNIGGYPASNYNVQFGTQLRLYKGLFFQSDGMHNWGIGGVKNNEDTYLLTYNLILNKSGRELLLSPLFGYSEIEVTQKKRPVYAQDSWISGINVSYETSHRIGVFVSAKYYSPISVRDNGILPVSAQPFSVSAGLLFKLKF